MSYAFLSNSFVIALMDIFRTIFEEVLSPILTEILEIFVDYVSHMVWAFWSGIVNLLFSMLCSLIDFVENIFNVFAGMAPVLVKGQSSPMYLIDALFQMEDISKAFMYITYMAIAICFIFTIYKTVKSISDMVLEDKNPVSKVLKDGLKATITFMMIPFLCIFMLRLSTVVTSNINNAFAIAQGGETASIGTVLFLSVSMDADKKTTEVKDLKTGEFTSIANRNPNLYDEVRKPYMNGTRDYRDQEQVREDFHVENFNYLAGFVCGAVLLLVMAGTVLTFIRRLFELLLLYIVSPLFVSTIPLDDGATFAKWRDLFVAKFFSGFGSVFIMKLYMMLIPMIVGSNLILYDKTLPGGRIINDILQLFFIVGGAWAVYKGQSLIMQIFNPQAAMTEREGSSLITGMIAGGASVAAAAATGGASAALTGAAGAANGVMGAVGGGNSDKNQAYRG